MDLQKELFKPLTGFHSKFSQGTIKALCISDYPSNDNVSPAELLMGRRLCARFGLKKLDVSKRVEGWPECQKLDHEKQQSIVSSQMEIVQW